MNSYYIKERDRNMTYIELRFLTEIECDLKEQKIQDILLFLNKHGFLNCLTIVNTNIRAEDIIEQEDIMSLTIDARNDKMRFKFWNGSTIFWLFHTQDLFDVLNTGREKFTKLYDKYEKLTELILNFKKRWGVSIDSVSYKYYPDSDIEVVYDIVFAEVVKNDDYNKILNKLMQEIYFTFKGDEADNLKFNITHSFKSVGCTPCEQARREREKNENKWEVDG